MSLFPDLPPSLPPQPKGGYAGKAGAGPAGETCGSCTHADGFRQSRSWYKCALMRAHRTGGRGTDIVLKTPACEHWEAQK